MSVRHRRRRWTRSGTGGAGLIKTIVRDHSRRDVDTRLYVVREKDPFAPDRTESV
jgi:hypothetical protein